MLRAFRELPKEANNELRDRSKKIADSLTPKVRAAGEAQGRQARIVARTVKARRDRVPVIQAGGATRVGRRKAKAGALVAGSEFGSSHYHQFRPHQGQDSYWFFKTVETEQAHIDEQWNKAADEILRAFRGV